MAGEAFVVVVVVWREVECGVDTPPETEVSGSSVAVNVFFVPGGVEEVVSMPDSSG